MNEKRYITCLTIAGSDPSGGAGIQADLKTFAALGIYGTSAITAITAQNTMGVYSSFVLPAKTVEEQIKAVFDDIRPQYIKIGMTANRDIITSVAKMLRQYAPAFIVLDPVMVSTSGHKLIDDDAIDALRFDLMPLASLVTPNLPECAVLAGTNIPQTENDVQTCGNIILRSCNAVLIKGGHFEHTPNSIDYLFTHNGCSIFTLPRVVTQNTHGTGCTLSAAIAAYAARGNDITTAVESAKSFLHNAITTGADVKTGNGHGPVNHFFKPERQLFE